MKAKRTTAASVPAETRRAVYRRDGWRCALCDDPRSLQLHHVWPRAHGGSDKVQNLITLCWKCHAVAHGTRLAEYPDYLDADAMTQLCVEYVSDLYAEQGEVWCPF